MITSTSGTNGFPQWPQPDFSQNPFTMLRGQVQTGLSNLHNQVNQDIGDGQRFIADRVRAAPTLVLGHYLDDFA